MLFTFAYSFVAMRIGLRLARQQQKHIIVSDVFLIISALCLLGLIICERVIGFFVRHWLTVVSGDTLAYTLGAMNPEFALADVVTAEDTDKQSVLDKVSGDSCLRLPCYLLLNQY
jgi:hypothetical protein